MRSKSLKICNYEKIKTVSRYRDLKERENRGLKLYSVGLTTFIDPTFTAIAIGIFGVACLENYLGTKGNVFLGDLIGVVCKFGLGIGGIIAAIHFLTSNAIMSWWL